MNMFLSYNANKLSKKLNFRTFWLPYQQELTLCKEKTSQKCIISLKGFKTIWIWHFLIICFVAWSKMGLSGYKVLCVFAILKNVYDTIKFKQRNRTIKNILKSLIYIATNLCTKVLNQICTKKIKSCV